MLAMLSVKGYTGTEDKLKDEGLKLSMLRTLMYANANRQLAATTRHSWVTSNLDFQY